MPTSRHWQRKSAAASLLLMSSLVTLTARGDTGSDRVHLGRDVFMSGDDVHLTGAVAGDALAAGGTVHVDAATEGDGLFVGGKLSVNASIGGDLYAAGKRVYVSAPVAGNVRIVGAEIFLAPEAVVTGAVTLIGANVEVGGTVDQYVQVLAGTTRVSGTVLGDLSVSGGELFIDPSAYVEGQVTFHGSQPATVAQGARLKGGVHYTPTPPDYAMDAGAIITIVMIAVGWWLGVALLLVGFWRLWPRIANNVADTSKQQTLKALGLGAAIAFAGPPVGLLLALSVIGLPLALLSLSIYIVLFPVGYVLGCGAVAQHLLGTRDAPSWRRRLMVTLGVLVITSVFATAIPVLGPLCAFGVSLVGAGGLVLTLFQATARVPTSSAPGGTTNSSANAPQPQPT